MKARERQAFPLVPRRRLVGLPFGDVPSRRRGIGTDVIGSRAYRPGDPIATIDWHASARLSTARGRDEFVVRARSSDEAPRVALICDRRPSMGLYPPPLPWLSKAGTLREAVGAIVVSASLARAELSYLDFAGGEAWWLSPGRRDRAALVLERQADSTGFRAPDDSLEQALAFLGRLRKDVSAGTFVFVLSDFLEPPAGETWLDAVARGWDVVPVVIQDPVWEQSFPAVAGAALPVADPRTGRASLVRLTRSEARARRRLHEERRRALLDDLAAQGLRPVLLSSSDPYDVDRAFLDWAEERRRGR